METQKKSGRYEQPFFKTKAEALVGAPERCLKCGSTNKQAWTDGDVECADCGEILLKRSKPYPPSRIVYRWTNELGNECSLRETDLGDDGGLHYSIGIKVLDPERRPGRPMNEELARRLMELVSPASPVVPLSPV